MITVTVASLVAAVRASLDELQTNASYMAGVQDTDNSDLDTIISGKVLEAIALVHRNAARSLVVADAPLQTTITASADGLVLSVNVPTTMLRFVSFKATDSPHAVTELLEEGSPDALRQADEYACGTWERPEAVLCKGSTNNVIRYYKLRTTLRPADNTATPAVAAEAASDRVEHLSYIPAPTIVSNSVDICAALKDAVVSMLTGLVLTVYKDSHADAFFSQAKLQMGQQ